MQAIERPPEIGQHLGERWHRQLGFILGDLFRLAGALEVTFEDFPPGDTSLAYLLGSREMEVPLRVVSQFFAEAAIKDAWSPR
jgi:hypothetical protein